MHRATIAVATRSRAIWIVLSLVAAIVAACKGGGTSGY